MDQQPPIYVKLLWKKVSRYQSMTLWEMKE